jgi:hypothetical protein
VSTEDESGETHDNSTVLYFLDVLTSGLGAAILLFIVFSVLPHFGDTGSKSDTRGQDAAAGPPIGAAAEPLESLARQARISFAATVVYPHSADVKEKKKVDPAKILRPPVDPKQAKNPPGKQPSAPPKTPPPTVPAGLGRWNGLPPTRPGVVSAVEEAVLDQPFARRFLVTCEKGISPESKIQFELPNPPRHAFDVQIRIGVGGLIQERGVRVLYFPERTEWEANFEPPEPNAKPVVLRQATGQPLAVMRIDLQNRRKPAKDAASTGPYDWILLP